MNAPERLPLPDIQSLTDDRAIAIEVEVPVTGLCLCSKEISAYGAHNQRSAVTISAVVATPLDPEDLIAMAERAASCEIYGLLKRPDEMYVTERAYDNPRRRDCAVARACVCLRRDGGNGPGYGTRVITECMREGCSFLSPRPFPLSPIP